MRKTRFLKKAVLTAGLAIISYTAIALIFVWHDKVIPPELTTSWFVSWAGEGVLTSWIKVSENKKDCKKGE